MANGIVSISGSGSSCKLLSAPTFDKKRSKSSDKICDDKIKRWVRSSSQEYDEVPAANNPAHQLTRCPSNNGGGTSEAAEAAASIAMQTLRKHYSETIHAAGSNMETIKSSEYLNQTKQTSSICKSGVNNLSLPMSSSNFDHVHQRAVGASMSSPRKSDSPSPPPPPPHRNVASPTKVKIRRLVTTSFVLL